MISFVLRNQPDYKAGWVHKDICTRLEKFEEDIIEKRSPRLMIQMPPRAGKSQLASIYFPAWFLGRNPDKEIIISSYSGSLAMDFSRKTRQILRERADFKVLFPRTALHKEMQNAEGWFTTKGGSYTPAGVGGPISGKGAHLLIVDDPIKNAEEAESSSNRQKIWDWFCSTAYTRLAPGAGVLVIQTRWHDDDLSGRLEIGEEEYELIRYAAVAEKDEKYRKKGEALHPERYDLKSLDRIKTAVGPRVWHALYQQNPVPDDGSYFQRSMIQYYNIGDLPENMMKYSAWDFAIGQKERSDFTVGLTWGLAEDENLYLLDMRRGRWDTYEIVEEIIDQYRKHKSALVGVERGQVRLAVGPYLEQRLHEERLWSFPLEDLVPGKRDKVARARTVQGLMRQGRVFFPKTDWAETLIHEMLRFPDGAHDDCVDAFSWLGLMLSDMIVPYIVSDKTPRSKSWVDRIFAYRKAKRNAMTA